MVERAENSDISTDHRSNMGRIEAAIDRGDVDSININLSRLNTPETEKLELLAKGYDKKADFDDAYGARIRTDLPPYLIPPSQLDAFGARSVAAELRRRKEVLEQRSSPQINPST